MSVMCYMCISSVVFMQSPTASLILSHPYIARQSRCLRSLFCPLLTLMMTHCSILLRRRTYAVLILHRHMQGRELWYSLTLSTVGSHDPFGCFHFSCLQILSFRCSFFFFQGLLVFSIPAYHGYKISPLLSVDKIKLTRCVS